EVGGKPSIVPVVSNIPTQEHGLQVKIAIKNMTDKGRFGTLIHRIVQNGAMNMELNGIRLPSLPFNDMVHGFMLTKKKVLETFKQIVVRYGNVIYPIERAEEYGLQWDQITEFLKRLNGTGYYARDNTTWTLVLQAAPNTVSVTPSRESLSNQKHTIEAIRELMLGFLGTKDKELTVECFKLLEERIEKTWIESAPHVLFNTEQSIPNLYNVNRSHDGSINTHRQGDFKFETHDNLTNFPQFVRQYAHAGYPDFANFRRRDMMLRINSLLVSGFGGQKMKKLLKSYRRAYEQEAHLVRGHKHKPGDRYKSTQEESPWFHQHVLWPLMKGMSKEINGLSPNKLFVYAEPVRGFSRSSEKVVEAVKYAPEPIEKMFPFARNIVILSFNKMDVVDGGADKAAICKYWLGSSNKSIVYVVPRADAKVEAARKYFLDLGVHLIDLTVDQQRNYIRKQEEIKEQPQLRRPKKNGIPKLSAMTNGNGLYQSNRVEVQPEVDRTTLPEFIIKDGRRNEYDFIEGLDQGQSKLIIDVYGSKGAVCANQNQYDRYKAAGALDWQDYILNNLVEEFETNPRIREFLPFDTDRMDTRRYHSEWHGQAMWVDIIKSDRDFYEYFGLVDNLTEDDRKLMKIWQIFKANYWRGTSQQGAKIEEIISAFKLDPVVDNLFRKLKSNKLIQMMDGGGAAHTIMRWKSYGLTEKQRIIARDALLTIIEEG
uniref:hypothetical protein n=1 Tax=Aquabacterium sp. TaxID=1872578 RepID=UPI0025BE8A2A